MQVRGDAANPSFHPRNIDAFRISYANPPCAWDIRLRTRRDENEWLITEAQSPWFPILQRHGDAQQQQQQAQVREGRDEEFVKEVRKLFWDVEAVEVRDGWQGLKGCMVAGWEGIGKAIGALDEVATRFRKEGRGLGGSGPGGGQPKDSNKGPHGGSGAGAAGSSKQKSAVAVGAEVVVLD